MSKNVNKWSEIANLVLNPRSNDVKLETYSSLILDVLFEEKNRQLNFNEISESIKTKFSLTNISPLILEDTIKHLISNEIIENKNSDYSITQENLKIIKTEKNKVNNVYNKLLNSLGDEVAIILGIKLDRHQLFLIRNVFEKSLYEIFENMSQNALYFLNQSKVPPNISSLQKIILKHAEIIKEPTIDNAKKIREVLPEAIYSIFVRPSSDFSKGLLMVSNKHVMWRILGTDPELSSLRADLFSNMALLLDTNIVISSLCEGSVRHRHTNWILDTTKSVGLELLISDNTITEFHDALNHANYIYTKHKGAELSMQILNNEITNTFYTYKEKHTDWHGFITRLKEDFADFMNKWNIRALNTSDFNIDIKKIAKIVEVIKEIELEYMKVRPMELARHDAINIMIVQALREETGANFTSHWYLTHHGLLLETDKIIKELYNYNQVSSISCDTWFEIMYPFIWADLDKSEDAAKIYTQIVASTVLPIQASHIDAFLGYVAGELDLSDEDYNKIKRIIRESHLKRVLENTLNQNDISVPLRILGAMIGDSVEAYKQVERYKTIIVDLSKKLEETRIDIEIVNFDTREFRNKIVEIENAVTNDQKKKTLENFADYLVSLIQGWETRHIDINLEAEEIDLIVQNKLNSRKWGDPILIECKNWSKPVGADQITVFLDKIEKMRGFVGILIAKNGITGNEKSDAGLKVREALSKNGIRIIVLTLDDFKSVENGTQLIKLMNDRYYIPSKYLK